MKKVLLLSLIFTINHFFAQTYKSDKINLLALINPNGGTVTAGWAGNVYSGCWGWFQSSTNKEYAIVGAANGTYFIDVTVPTSPTVSAFVPGRTGCTWRELKTYQNYCYVVSDDSPPNTFQIIDMSALPATVTVVHNGTSLFETAHTIWIDQDKMYVGGPRYSTTVTSTPPQPMNIYSLATPTAPVLLRELSQDISASTIPYVHDMFVRNDTVYASAGNSGLYILKYNTATNTFSILGSYVGYQNSGYNHSSFLTQNGKYLVFCDEVPAELPIHFVDVQNLANIQPVQTLKPAQGTTPHNPYIKGNNFAIVSCYQDGLVIYDISQPNNIGLAGYFDTYPQGGNDVGNYAGGAYKGNWGAYPFLPSGIIIATDMQNGVFILDATPAYTNTIKNPLGINNNQLPSIQFNVYPNPAVNSVNIKTENAGQAHLKVSNLLGEIVYEKNYTNEIDEKIDTRNFESGIYLFVLTSNQIEKQQKIVITH